MLRDASYASVTVLFQGGFSVKTIVAIILSVFLSATLASSFTPAFAAARGAMSGKGDYATKGYNQAAAKEKPKGAKMTKKPQ
jgi:hypothetical protein